MRCAVITGFEQPLQTNDFIALYMLPFIPLHFLCTHLWQLVHCIELLTTPPTHTPHDYLVAFCTGFWSSPLIITLVLFVFTLIPLFSTLFFYLLSLLIKSSSVSAITSKSSAYNSYQGKATLNSLDMASMTITNNSGLNDAEPWCMPTFTSRPLL